MVCLRKNGALDVDGVEAVSRFFEIVGYNVADARELAAILNG
jgi:hypothetical protein